MLFLCETHNKIVNEKTIILAMFEQRNWADKSSRVNRPLTNRVNITLRVNWLLDP